MLGAIGVVPPGIDVWRMLGREEKTEKRKSGGVIEGRGNSESGRVGWSFIAGCDV
jgi:hypothetical protein